MNKKILIAVSIVACMTMSAFAHHHHHDGFWGGFVGGLFGGMLSSAPRTTIVAQPAPVVVTQPVVAQPVVAQPVIASPVVQTTTFIAQPPATITYGVYNF